MRVRGESPALQTFKRLKTLINVHLAPTKIPQKHIHWLATMTQESIFIGLIGFSRSKFQDFEARILALTSS